ncbi:MAG TPA: T9SS type A sorting domain-containing protein, partial [Saprospiraceae bacterium]|nr:T9SS type A sorting domain-containing protein [Saprospiraceae bacterium]
GTFEEPGKIAFKQILPKPADGTPTATLYGNILVPATALPGTTRMRVAMKRGGAPGPCEIFAFGEAEDYSVNIASSLQSSYVRANVTSMAVSQDFDLFPNPTNGEFTVLIQDGWSSEIRLFDLNGRMLTQVKIEQTTRFDLSAQPAGMYLLDIRFENGERRREKIIKE